MKTRHRVGARRLSRKIEEYLVQHGLRSRDASYVETLDALFIFQRLVRLQVPDEHLDILKDYEATSTYEEILRFGYDEVSERFWSLVPPVALGRLCPSMSWFNLDNNKHIFESLVKARITLQEIRRASDIERQAFLIGRNLEGNNSENVAERFPELDLSAADIRGLILAKGERS